MRRCDCTLGERTLDPDRERCSHNLTHTNIHTKMHSIMTNTHKEASPFETQAQIRTRSFPQISICLSRFQLHNGLSRKKAQRKEHSLTPYKATYSSLAALFSLLCPSFLFPFIFSLFLHYIPLDYQLPWQMIHTKSMSCMIIDLSVLCTCTQRQHHSWCTLTFRYRDI